MLLSDICVHCHVRADDIKCDIQLWMQSQISICISLVFNDVYLFNKVQISGLAEHKMQVKKTVPYDVTLKLDKQLWYIGLHGCLYLDLAKITLYSGNSGHPRWQRVEDLADGLWTFEWDNRVVCNCTYIYLQSTCDHAMGNYL